MYTLTFCTGSANNICCNLIKLTCLHATNIWIVLTAGISCNRLTYHNTISILDVPAVEFPKCVHKLLHTISEDQCRSHEPCMLSMQTAQLLHERGWLPEVVMSSNSERTKQTLEAMQEAVDAFRYVWHRFYTLPASSRLIIAWFQ